MMGRSTSLCSIILRTAKRMRTANVGVRRKMIPQRCEKIFQKASSGLAVERADRKRVASYAPIHQGVLRGLKLGRGLVGSE